MPGSSCPIQIPASHGSLVKVNHLSASAALRGEPVRVRTLCQTLPGPLDGAEATGDAGLCGGMGGAGRTLKPHRPLRGWCRLGLAVSVSTSAPLGAFVIFRRLGVLSRWCRGPVAEGLAQTPFCFSTEPGGGVKPLSGGGGCTHVAKSWSRIEPGAAPIR